MTKEINIYEIEAKALISWHKKIYIGHICHAPINMIKYITNSIDKYDKEYLQEFDRELLINEVKKQLGL